MPTYAWNLTRENLVASILRKLGVLGGNGRVEPEDAALVSEALDARLKEMHALGVLWWRVAGAQTPITVTGGIATAAIGAGDYLFPVSMTLTVGQAQHPLEIIGHRQYQAIPDKGTDGEPERVFIDGTTCRFHPVPRSSGTANLTYQAIAADTESGVPVDVPVSMTRALVYVIAGDLVDEYEVPPEKAARLVARQAEGLNLIRMLKREAVSTATVQPEWY